MKSPSHERIRVAVLGVRGIPEVQGGIERHCQELYPRLVRLGCEVVIIARKGYVPPNPYVYKGVKVIPIWTIRRKYLETIFHSFIGILWLVFHYKQFNIVHVHAIGPSLFIPLARILGLKVITTNHGPDYDRRKWGWLAKSILRIGERFGTQYSHAIIAVAQYIKKYLSQTYNRDVFYIPNGAQPNTLKPSTDLLNRFDLESGRYIIAVGRLVPEKGFHDLLEVFSKIKTEYKLIIAGSAVFDDNYSRNLKKRAVEVENVVLTGFLKSVELNELYYHAGFFVQPSYHEGLSLSLLEALSYALPVLVSDIISNKEVELPAERYFKCGNLDDLQNKLKVLLGKKLTISEHQIIRQQIENKYNWELIARQTFDVYEKVLDAI